MNVLLIAGVFPGTLHQLSSHAHTAALLGIANNMAFKLQNSYSVGAVGKRLTMEYDPARLIQRAFHNLIGDQQAQRQPCYLRAVFVSAVPRAGAGLRMCDASDDALAQLLVACAGSPEKLAAKLKKEQLSSACAARGLAATGTKSVLAARLIDQMDQQSEQSVETDGTTLAPTQHAASAVEAAEAPAAPSRRSSFVPRQQSADPTIPIDPHDSAAVIADADADANAGGQRELFSGEGAAESVRPSADEGFADEEMSMSSGSEMEVVVLGSGACYPSPSRSAACVAMRLIGSYWLFDVGEGSQVQLQKCFIKPGLISHIFVTHTHGDHCFGLPGLLCLIARGRDGKEPVQIVGPAGLRTFLRVVLRYTGTRMLPQFVVHELQDIPYLHFGKPPLLLPSASPDLRESQFGEQPGGRDIERDSDGVWTVLTAKEGDMRLTVRAAPLQHGARTVGYVVEEDEKSGRLNPQVGRLRQLGAVMPHLERNRLAIREQWNIRDPRYLMKRIKALAPGESLTLPDGHVITSETAVGGVRKGRKVAILGDCCNASMMAPIAANADLLVHEATNAYMPMFGDTGGIGLLERRTIQRGHSTPQMAGRTAADFGAHALLLTHFSQRYHPKARRIMRAIEAAAQQAAELPLENVVAANDGMVIPVWQKDRKKPLRPHSAHVPPEGASEDPEFAQDLMALS